MMATLVLLACLSGNCEVVNLPVDSCGPPSVAALADWLVKNPYPTLVSINCEPSK